MIEAAFGLLPPAENIYIMPGVMPGISRLRE